MGDGDDDPDGDEGDEGGRGRDGGLAWRGPGQPGDGDRPGRAGGDDGERHQGDPERRQRPDARDDLPEVHEQVGSGHDGDGGEEERADPARWHCRHRVARAYLSASVTKAQDRGNREPGSAGPSTQRPDLTMH